MQADFIKAFRTGETPQGEMDPKLMPYDGYQMEDDDLKALYLNLKSLPAAQPDN